MLDKVTMLISVPGLHRTILRVPPVTRAPEPYAAVFTFNWVSASGTSCFLAALTAAALLGVKPSGLWRIYKGTAKQLAFPMLTIAIMLAVAYLMNYSGIDRKSTRLNSSHRTISYAVFCLK